MKYREVVFSVKTGKEEIIERELTDEEIDNMKKAQAESEKQEQQEERLAEIDAELDELNKDFIQVQCGAVIPDIKERKLKFQSLHNEKRALLGKEPREYVEIFKEDFVEVKTEEKTEA